MEALTKRLDVETFIYGRDPSSCLEERLESAYEIPVHPGPQLRQHAAIAIVLVVACKRKPLSTPQHHVDASVHVAVSASARGDAGTSPDSTVREVPRPHLHLYVVGGSGLVREGAPVQVRVVRDGVGGGPDTEVTNAVTLRVDPPDRGDIDHAGLFRGRGRGRVRIVASQGSDEVSTIVEVNNELLAGTDVLPMFRSNGGLVPLLIRFDARPNGTIQAHLVFVNRSIMLEGHRVGRSFPITVPVRESQPPDNHVPGPPVTGTIVLDRWANGRLDGHGTFRLQARSIGFWFAVMADNPVPVLSAPAPAR